MMTLMKGVIRYLFVLNNPVIRFFPSTTGRWNVTISSLFIGKQQSRAVAIDPSSSRHPSAFSLHIPRPIPISSLHTDITAHTGQFNPAFIYPSVHLPCPQPRTDYLPTNDSQQQVSFVLLISLQTHVFHSLFSLFFPLRTSITYFTLSSITVTLPLNCGRSVHSCMCTPIIHIYGSFRLSRHVKH